MSLTAVQADLSLHHLEIQSSNPERLSNFYSNIMDMKIDKLSSDKFLCDGPSRKIITTLGKNKTLSHQNQSLPKGSKTPPKYSPNVPKLL